MPDTVPPVPQTPTASPVTFGTILHFGLAGIDVIGIIVDSYKRDAQYGQTQEVTDQVGIVIGLRMSDFRANVSVDGRVLQTGNLAFMPNIKAGDILTINVDKIVITSVSYSGQANGFHNLSLSGTAYSGITALAPAGAAAYTPVTPGTT